MGNILTYTHINNNTIYKDGKVVLNIPEISLDDFLLQAYEVLKISYPKFYKMDRLCKLGLLASEVLLSNQKKFTSEAAAVVLSNSHSSLDTDIRFWESARSAASPSLFVYTLPNIVAGEICIRNGFKGEGNFFVTPVFDPQWINNYVDQVLVSQNIEVCLAGWVDIWNDQAEVFLYLTHKSETGIGSNSTKTVRELYSIWKN